MDRITSATSSHTTVQALQHVSAPQALPDDVLPNIFSRLPTPELFALASVSKRVQHLIQGLLPEATGRELLTLSPRRLEDFVERLAVLLRVGGHHISNRDWTNFLQAAGVKNLDRRLILVLVLSLAREGATLRKRQDTIAVANSGIHPVELNESEFATLICAAGMKQLMRVERLGSVGKAKLTQLNHSSAWKQLVNLFRFFSPVNQVNLLLQVKPRESDGANIGLAFDELLDTHLANLVETGGFPYLNQCLWQQPGKRSAYFDIVSNAYTMGRSPDHITYFQEMCSKTTCLGLASGVWRQDSREHCNFVLRLLAYETRTNLTQNLKTLSYAIRFEVGSSFLTKEELNDFTKKLNVRIDRGMLLEDAVSLWIDENQNPSTCVVS